MSKIGNVNFLIRAKSFPLPKCQERFFVETSDSPKRVPIHSPCPFQRIAGNPIKGAVNSFSHPRMRPPLLVGEQPTPPRPSASPSSIAQLLLTGEIARKPQRKPWKVGHGDQNPAEVGSGEGTASVLARSHLRTLLGRPSGRDSVVTTNKNGLRPWNENSLARVKMFSIFTSINMFQANIDVENSRLIVRK